ncbi:hypothetical protein CALVIDRAFT_398460 [Calocera viscosa TUFC12733]|uniref:Uncharacterized protein n=1 Tax=Calocera viscosa (strain TUFC12733) TaxID=1330018 RepID=A0A167PS98_CALVF|nr:hypothetical protein CALVIDRAFT_398460 [Calocera viscosa TUFC12733]
MSYMPGSSPAQTSHDAPPNSPCPLLRAHRRPRPVHRQPDHPRLLGHLQVVYVGERLFGSGVNSNQCQPSRLITGLPPYPCVSFHDEPTVNMRPAALFLLASGVPALAKQCTSNDIRPDSLGTSEVIFYDTDGGHHLLEDLFAALGTKI